MSVRLAELLEPVLRGEPPLGDEVDAVFRRADRLRTLRTRLLLASGGAAVAVIVVAGYVLTTTLMPRRDPVVKSLPAPVASPAPPPSPVTPSPSPRPAGDAVRRVITPGIDAKGLHLLAGSRGQGWREYPVRDAEGIRRGTVLVAVYRAAGDLCFPVLAAPGRCARAEKASEAIQFVRYDDESDPDRQVHQTIAHGNGRVLAVLAAGERDTSAKRGKPALSGKQVETVATDERLFEAFGADERCDDACPAFPVSVPAA
jgi:hypothetical protein